MEDDNSTDTTSQDSRGAENVADQTGLSQLVGWLMQECAHKIHLTPRPEDGRVYCEATTDQWGGCWMYTAAGSTASLACNETIFRIHHPVKQAAATRKCEANGTWYVSPNTQKEYSNYTACTHNLEELATNHMIPIYVFIGGYSVSIVMLLISHSNQP